MELSCSFLPVTFAVLTVDQSFERSVESCSQQNQDSHAS